MTAQYQEISKIEPTSLLILRFQEDMRVLSVWVLTQQLTSIAKPFRDNVACVVAFHNPSQIGMKSLFEEFGGDLDSQTRKNLTKNLKSENCSTLCFSLRNPYHCYLRIPSPVERQGLKNL